MIIKCDDINSPSTFGVFFSLYNSRQQKHTFQSAVSTYKER